MAIQVVVGACMLAMTICSVAGLSMCPKSLGSEMSVQMDSSKNQQALREHLDIFLASLPLIDRELSSADVERGQRSKQIILQGKAESVPVLLDGIKRPDFVSKDACYDLLLEIGLPAKEALYSELGERGPDVDIWIIAMLRQLGDDSVTVRLWAMLEDPSRYIQHISALALAFQGIDSEAEVREEQLFPFLVDALSSERNIEGTPFSVAGSALGCLTRMSGENFLSYPHEITFYNYEHFLYPPPIHPFPFAADFYSKASVEEQRLIRQRVKAWLAQETTQ